MRRILEDFYYGNIRPFEQKMVTNSSLRRAVDAMTRYETQLAEQLNETEKTLLDELIQAQQEIDSITAAENFILGFQLGVRLMAECIDENDGAIKGVTDDG